MATVKATTNKTTDPSIKKAPATVIPPFYIQQMEKQKRFLKAIIYGDYGVGKTHLLGTSVVVPSMRDVLLINAEKGDLTLENPAFPFEKIDVIQVNNYKQFARVLDFLKLHVKLRDANDIEGLLNLEEKVTHVKPSEPKKYYTVLIDSLQEIETFCMYQLLSISEDTKVDEETMTAEWAEYKRNLTMISRVMRQLRDLPLHVLYSCPQNYIQDEAKKFHYTLKMTGQLTKAVQGHVDLVGRLVLGSPGEDGVIPRRLWVQPVGRWDAKCRFSNYKGTHFDNPTIESILKAVGLLGTTTKAVTKPSK